IKCESEMPTKLISLIRDVYRTKDFIPLHAPVFAGNELRYIEETIQSTFVSSVGRYVIELEHLVEAFTGSVRAVATVNGTAALQAALYLAGVKEGHLVLTQALTFVATCNAIHHLGARPVFVDIDRTCLGLSPQ